ncbi:GNAT family N-acetyltransferase [Streptomyces zagrosensis]|uniref:Ribosomal protein S18 acetylase RimI-like enzyme n=1 Tax=Streptomyces zagrosensis TaxID=1042984 RepID=A0A7W9UW83_9ACTN|nr:GNAT family N-acetyltransferase [Streptomyces zagrosensis]MBB5933046.1 ribosomal protein S18 acetylase RimI-like enzyme [Streptomyces zagrosensis]
MTSHHATLDRLERFYDAVPRHGARAEEFGPLTLFVREGEGWPFYARPALGQDGPVDPGDVDRVRGRQRALGLPESFEWVAETSPGLRSAVERSGLAVREHPLLVLPHTALLPIVRHRPDGVTIRMVAPADPTLASALTVPHLAFAEPGTRVGVAGPAELTAALPQYGTDKAVRIVAERIRAGRTALAAAVDDDSGLALCAGQRHVVNDVSEIVGVGTLPTARRRGLALAVTAALASDARTRGVRAIFLSAGDADVARLYGQIGFIRVGTALIAEPPT